MKHQPQHHLVEGILRYIRISSIFLILLSACSTAATTPIATQLPNTGSSISASPSAATHNTLAATAVILPANNTSPVCTSPATLTPAVTEGPYFKANSPERASLLDQGITGTKLTLTGYVLTPDCKPVIHAMLDFWQANSQGQYDNSGYTLRGHQFTDAIGRYQLETIIPGLYPGRTEHIHVKVQAPGGPILTTQLFFPGVQDNQSDGIFNPALLIHVQTQDSRSMQATYDFIITPKEK